VATGEIDRARPAPLRIVWRPRQSLWATSTMKPTVPFKPAAHSQRLPVNKRYFDVDLSKKSGQLVLTANCNCVSLIFPQDGFAVQLQQDRRPIGGKDHRRFVTYRDGCRWLRFFPPSRSIGPARW